jgi:hypothetical protein
VHVHQFDRHWGVADSPLNGIQPDPFLEHDTDDASVGLSHTTGAVRY